MTPRMTQTSSMLSTVCDLRMTHSSSGNRQFERMFSMLLGWEIVCLATCTVSEQLHAHVPSA
jgi:hypothetical protein